MDNARARLSVTPDINDPFNQVVIFAVNWSKDGKTFGRGCRLPLDYSATDVEKAWDRLWELMKAASHD
jgi:hypothetical protein